MACEEYAQAVLLGSGGSPRGRCSVQREAISLVQGEIADVEPGLRPGDRNVSYRCHMLVPCTHQLPHAPWSTGNLSNSLTVVWRRRRSTVSSSGTARPMRFCLRSSAGARRRLAGSSMQFGCPQRCAWPNWRASGSGSYVIVTRGSPNASRGTPGRRGSCFSQAGSRRARPSGSWVPGRARRTAQTSQPDTAPSPPTWVGV